MREWDRDAKGISARCDVCGRDVLMPVDRPSGADPNRFVEPTRDEVEDATP